jgi:hypothetical protein
MSITIGNKTRKPRRGAFAATGLVFSGRPIGPTGYSVLLDRYKQRASLPVHEKKRVATSLVHRFLELRDILHRLMVDFLDHVSSP